MLRQAPVLPAPPPLAELLPGGGFRRGTVVGLGASCGSTSLLLAALVPAVGAGSWLAVVGLPGLGVEAAQGLGLALERLVLVPDPGRQPAGVVAALVDAVDVVAVGAGQAVGAGDARRLGARVRERHGLLVVAGDAWPEPVDIRLELADPAWSELEAGDGTLCRREVTVTVSGRRAASRRGTARVLLPGPDGRLRPVARPEGEVVGPPLRALAG